MGFFHYWLITDYNAKSSRLTNEIFKYSLPRLVQDYYYYFFFSLQRQQFSNRATKKFRKKKKKKSHDSNTDNCTIFHAWWLKVADGDLICWKQQRDKRFISIPPMTQATRRTMAARVSARFPRSGVGVSRMAKTDTRVPRTFTRPSASSSCWTESFVASATSWVLARIRMNARLVAWSRRQKKEEEEEE